MRPPVLAPDGMVGWNLKPLLTALVAVLVAVGVTTAAGAGAVSWTGDLNDLGVSQNAAGTLSLAVDQNASTGEPVVTVTSNGTAVENATVIVEGDAYAGNGSYATDANGTVTLPEPNESVTVNVTAADDGATASLTVTLVPRADSLAVDVNQHDDGTATVSVTQYGDAVDNATVTVSGDAYAGNGTYATDANGTVSLPAPNETVTVNVSAAHDNLTAETTATLFPDALEVTVEQHADGTATVTVTENGSAAANATVEVSGDAYAGNGTYTTDGNGTVSLPAPDEDVTVTVTARKGDESGTTTVTLDGIGELGISVEQHADATVTVTVTRNGTPVDNATVTVEGNAFAGNGTYATDANGTVSLPAPDEDVTVTITAMDDNDVASVTVALDGTSDLSVAIAQHDDGTATVTVTRNGSAVENATVEVSANHSYAGNGTYSTDANGTVSLPAPDQDVTVTVTASEGNDTAQASATLQAPDEDELAIGVHQGAGYVVIAVTDNGTRLANATVTIDGLGALAGTYATDDDGFVVLDAPTTGGQITISATHDGLSADRTVSVRGFNGRGPDHVPFGKYVEAYKDALRHDELSAPMGHYISDFTSSENPGKDDGDSGESHGNGQGNGHGQGHGNGHGN